MLNYHQDAGHGWLEVPASDIAAVGLTSAAFSSCTYIDANNGETVYYLEEDCDMPLFILAYGNRQFKRPELNTVYHDGESYIRDLPRNVS